MTNTTLQQPIAARWVLMLLAISGVLMVSGVCAHKAKAYELSGDQLELYLMLNSSVDLLHSDITKDEAQQTNADNLTERSVSVSFNASRLGFKGYRATDWPGLIAFFQLEQSIFAEGGDADELSSRNSFVGLRNTLYTGSAYNRRYWEILAGRHDSLFKSVALEYSLLKHSVADRGAILGAGALKGNSLDRRVENTLITRWKGTLSHGALRTQLQYSSDATASDGRADDNDTLYLGTAIDWKYRKVSLAAGYDHWQAFESTDTEGNAIQGEAMLWRLATRYQDDVLTLVALAEHTRFAVPVGQYSDLNRQAGALQLGYRFPYNSWFGGWQLLSSVMVAGDYKGQNESGAWMYSLGMDTELTSKMTGYWVATQTRNEKNARFQGVDGTHADELGTLNGQNPFALSVGFQIEF